jgi:hypothetical protein
MIMTGGGRAVPGGTAPDRVIVSGIADKCPTGRGHGLDSARAAR